MAAILDPKTRFFDTFLTKEGRRQLGSGELRMRYVSFSDRATTYDDAGDRVIYSKDGSVFFEAMSKPQDQIIHESPSIVNMMSINDPDSQPVFLNDGSGNRIQAAMFGDRIISPPDGRFISSSLTTGVDRIKVNLDLNKNLYVSGSRTQEIQYTNSDTLVGWWVFEDTMDQIATSGVNFNLDNVVKLTTDVTGENPSNVEINSVTYKNFNTSHSALYLTLKNLEVFRGVKIGDKLEYGAYSAVITDIPESIAGFGLNPNDSGHLVVKLGNVAGSSEALVSKLKIGTIGSFLSVGSKVSENLKRRSALETNAAYIKKADGSSTMQPDDSPTFNGNHLKHLSRKVNKSWTGAANKAIRISLHGEHYGINSSIHSKDGNSTVFPNASGRIDLLDTPLKEYQYNNLGHQLSFTFYLNNPSDGKTETIAQIFDHGNINGFNSIKSRTRSAEIFTIGDDLYLRIYCFKTSAPPFSGTDYRDFIILNEIRSNTWHRVSLAWNRYYFSMVLDGNMSKSITRAYNYVDPRKGALAPEESAEYPIGGFHRRVYAGINHGYLQFDPNGGSFIGKLLGSGMHDDTYRYTLPNNPVDLVLGNMVGINSDFYLSNETGKFKFVSNTHLNGYIQSCEYYVDTKDNLNRHTGQLGIEFNTEGRFGTIQPPYVEQNFGPGNLGLASPDDYETGNGIVSNMDLPIFNNTPNFSKHFEFKFDLNQGNIVSDQSINTPAKGIVSFVHAYDRKYDNEIDNFSISLTDSSGFTVLFKAKQSIPGSLTHRKVSSTEYEFLTPNYTDHANKVNSESRLTLAANFMSAVNLANSNNDLQITAELNPAVRRNVVLSQVAPGFSGNTDIVVNSHDPESTFLTHFTGGKFTGFLRRKSSWQTRTKMESLMGIDDIHSTTADSNYQYGNYKNRYGGDTIYDSYFGGIPIESDVSLREWTNYYPISSEATLFFATMSGSFYQKEEKINRKDVMLSFPEMVKSVSSILSGSVDSYKDLQLLGHLDLNKKDDEQGFLATRRREEISTQGIPGFVATSRVVPATAGKWGDHPAVYGEETTTVFKTRYKKFQFIEHPYGQHNDYQRPVPEIANLDSGSPVSGLFFSKEATLFHLEEIIDNDFDNDESTRSSTRLPNFLVLPPLCTNNLVFDYPDYDMANFARAGETDIYPWRQFLKYISQYGVDRPIDDRCPGWYDEEAASDVMQSKITHYIEHIKSTFGSIIPRDTLEKILNTGNMFDENADSNQQIISYLARNHNTSARNKINVDLTEFNEKINFNKTSYNQNTFVQMFELSNDDNKPTFKKLAIRDLGIFFKSNPDSPPTSVEDIEFRGTPKNDLEKRPIDDISVIGGSLRDNAHLVHAFTFGKIIRDKQGNQPGTGIYYVPIFYFEAKLGDEQ